MEFFFYKEGADFQQSPGVLYEAKKENLYSQMGQLCWYLRAHLIATTATSAVGFLTTGAEWLIIELRKDDAAQHNYVAQVRGPALDWRPV